MGVLEARAPSSAAIFNMDLLSSNIIKKVSLKADTEAGLLVDSKSSQVLKQD